MALRRRSSLARAALPLAAVVAIAAAALYVIGGTDDDGEPLPSSTTTTDGPTETTGSALSRQLIDLSELPEGFDLSGEVDDTITSFCAGEDAAAGLSASARVTAGFNRETPGSSVVQLVFDFEGDDAATFVAQADAILERCSEVPDFTGLAFDYEPVSDELTDIFAPTDAHTAGFGTSIGSGNLTVNVAVFHRGDVGELVAVLGIDLPRAQLDDLAAAAFTAAVERLTQ